ncbi:uroporphyrinogen-III synthase [Pyrobaculum sp.]|uniref:uroporphyrinogen-III synthase n=1 Tax=Pyrobaculum sp. TaxID=2004705 RepID=UPI003166EE39
MSVDSRVVVVRVKDGPCPEGAFCVSIGRVVPRRGVEVPDGDYLVVMSPAVADAVDVAALAGRFRCVICVGPSAAARVGKCVVPREYTSYGIAELLKSLAPGRVVVLRSSSGNEVLRSLVPNVVEVAVYDLVIDEERVREVAGILSRAEAVVLTSAKVAEAVAKYVDLSGKTVVAIGRVTSQKLAQLGVLHLVADEATIKSAVEAALRAIG